MRRMPYVHSFPFNVRRLPPSHPLCRQSSVLSPLPVGHCVALRWIGFDFASFGRLAAIALFGRFACPAMGSIFNGEINIEIAFGH